MSRKPPTESSTADASSRRGRLRARRSRRTRGVIAVLVILIAGVAAAAAYALKGDDTPAHATNQLGPTTPTFGKDGTLVPSGAAKANPVRALDHTHPLKLWVG